VRPVNTSFAGHSITVPGAHLYVLLLAVLPAVLLFCGVLYSSIRTFCCHSYSRARHFVSWGAFVYWWAGGWHCMVFVAYL